MGSKNIKAVLKKKIAQTLLSTFSDLQQGIGSKKFRKNVKKASKALAVGVPKESLEAMGIVKEKKSTAKKRRKEELENKPIEDIA